MHCSVGLLILAVAVGLASAVCPVGYLEFQEAACLPAVCLRFAQEQKATWYVWDALCKAENATLAKVTGNIHAQVYQYISSHPDLRDEAFWIGGTDMVTEGDWRWTLDNSVVEMGTPHWDPVSPQQPDGGTAQNFMCLWNPRFYWASCQNTVEIYAICQF